MALWYAAIVKRGRERLFAEALGAAGYEGYVPLHAERRLVSRRPARWEMRSVPIIRGLVFIGAAADLASDAYAWQDVAAIPNYKALVGMLGVPQRIRDVEIARMIEAREGMADLHIGAPQPRVRVGEDARMTSGAFEGLRARVVTLRGKRATIMAQLLGGEREVEVDAMELEPWG